MRRLGLIGGLGPAATIHYYRALAEAGAGEMLLVHADLDRARGYVERGERAEMARYFAGLIARLAGGGAEIAAIAATTAHYCIADLERISPLPLVDLTALLNAEIVARGYRKVALLGTRFTAESRLFGRLDAGIEIVPGDYRAIHEAYLRIVYGDRAGLSELTRIAGTLQVDALVLSGTDLTGVFQPPPNAAPLLDAAEVHVLGILRQLGCA